jgi:hypothetical protein
LNQSGGVFKISPFFQETICYFGQKEVFEEASESIKRLRGVEVNAKQIERVCHHYGEVLEKELEQSIASGVPAFNEIDKEDVHYAMMDGSMILTREEKWKEIKLGRLFPAKSNVQISQGHGIITESHYVAHLGGHEEFLEKFDHYVSCLPNPVFIADGARWIWNWVEAFHPKAIQILDFYHAKEHLCQYAMLYFKEEIMAKQWIDDQTKLLLDDQVNEVISHIADLPDTNNKKEKQARDNLINYYSENSKRMQYKTFQESELLIGSGAIEAAHRTIIQHRLKLSGQRWTMKGAQQLVNLRMAHKSNQWNHVKDLTKNAA